MGTVLQHVHVQGMGRRQPDTFMGCAAGCAPFSSTAAVFPDATDAMLAGHALAPARLTEQEQQPHTT